MKKLLLLFILLYSSILLPQSDNAYQIEVRKESKIDNKTYEFEVYIKSPQKINLTAYQCVFLFNTNIIANGKLSIEYVENSSQLTNKPIKLQIVSFYETMLLAIASGPGLEQIQSEKMIGKFRVKNTKDFPKNEKLNLKWDFTDDVNTIITGTDNKDITNYFIFKPKK